MTKPDFVFSWGWCWFSFGHYIGLIVIECLLLPHITSQKRYQYFSFKLYHKLYITYGDYR